MDPHTHTATGETRFKEAGRVEAMDRTLRMLSHRTRSRRKGRQSSNKHVGLRYEWKCQRCIEKLNQS